jgi:hypothetical protein
MSDPTHWDTFHWFCCESITSRAEAACRMNTPCKHFVVLVVGVALPLATGCKSSGPQMVRIRGMVSYKGAPLTNVTQGIVRYSPKNGGSAAREATGRIQPDGSFVMTTFQRGDGVVVGEYDIAVSAYSNQELSRQETESGVHSAGPKLLIPERYLKSSTSGLSDTVAAGHPGFKQIELTDNS